MIKFYLLFNSALYLVFSLWCLIKPDETAKFLGYSFQNNSGKIEYLTIYVGFELGFAAFFAATAFYPSIRLAGLIFCVCLYTGAMVIRSGSTFLYGNASKVTYMIGGLEYLLGIFGIVLLVNELRKETFL